MNKSEWRMREDTIELFRLENPAIESYEMEKHVDALHRHETTLNRIFTNQANGYVSDRTNIENTAWKESDERAEKRSRAKVEAIAAQIGIPVKINTDPRGAAIKFYLASKRYNSFDGETWRLHW